MKSWREIAWQIMSEKIFKQKKIALINDMTGFGRCSITVELPIISALKIQACPLPTAILSVHTGFENYFLDDYTNNTKNFLDSWKKNKLEFDGIATGFFGSAKQIEIVGDFLKNSSAFVMIDPVMGDHGKIYKSYTREMCKDMKKLLQYADLITPNLTEACELLNMKYPADGVISDSDLAVMAANISAKMRGDQVVITGVNLDFDNRENISNFVYDNGKISVVTSKKYGADRSGTGDAFFAIVAAEILNGKNLSQAVKKAADFITKCILHAEKLNLAWNWGLPFEEFLTEL